MAIAQGWDGQILIGTNVIGKLTEWTLDAAAEVIEQTSFGDTYDRSYIPGMRGPHTVSYSGYRETTNAAQDAITDVFTGSSKPAAATLIMLTHKTTGAKAGFTGSGILTGFSQGVTMDGVQTFSGNAQLAGKLSTYSTA